MARSLGGAGTARRVTVTVNADGALTSRRPQAKLSSWQTPPPLDSLTKGDCHHPVSWINKRMDFVGLGGQMVHSFHKQ